MSEHLTPAELALCNKLGERWESERRLGWHSLKIEPISEFAKAVIRNLATHYRMTVRFDEFEGQLYLTAIRPRSAMTP